MDQAHVTHQCTAAEETDVVQEQAHPAVGTKTVPTIRHIYWRCLPQQENVILTLVPTLGRTAKLIKFMIESKEVFKRTCPEDDAIADRAWDERVRGHKVIYGQEKVDAEIKMIITDHVNPDVSKCIFTPRSN
jgi:hypothetical protein